MMLVGIWKTRTYSFLVVGLLVLAGVLSNAHVARAQSEGECVLPSGVAPLPDQRVTAQQVEDGSATLEDLVVAVRDQYVALPQDFTAVEGIAYVGCLVRQAGVSRSGSTYLVSMTPDGRVFAHAKDMFLSGRQLNPFIYSEVLTVLGASSIDLAGLTSPDPNVAAQASFSSFFTLPRQAHGSFDATTPVPGRRPGIPGASGHALVSLSANLALPLLLLAGFDLNESHLTQEAIDYGDPAITAKDVVDRETLKAFVAEAEKFLLDTLVNGGLVATAQARIVLRDPNGPWRHGSVYLYVLDLNSNIILVHGAFPTRFELRPLVATVRDAVTGKLVLPQVIEAAQSNPEGGFVEYYFDDPTDDTDSADIPKLGYARKLTRLVQRPDGGVVPVNFIVGSGFYRSSQPPVLDFAHFANGESFRTDVVLVNLAATPTQPLVYFYGPDGELIDPDSMVDITENLETTDFGALTLQSELPSLGEITISTNGMGDLVTGSVKVITRDLSPIGGVLRLGAPGIGVAGVAAGAPVRDALFPARYIEGGIRTAAAIRNLGEAAMEVQCSLMSAGGVLEEAAIPLQAHGQTSWFIEEAFTMTDTTDFTGTVRCTAPAESMFTGLAVEVDAANRLFTTLPVVEVEPPTDKGGATVLQFAHFANGGNSEQGGIRSELVLVNPEARPSGSSSGSTPFHPPVPESRPTIYFYDREGQMIDPAAVVEVTDELEVRQDGGLTAQSEMAPLGELTVATHGRGEELSGSVKVVSEGPIGGVLRYRVPGVGVTGVGAGTPVRDALFPARRIEGGIRTAAAIRNLGEEAMEVQCSLMSAGEVLEEAAVPLQAHGQTSWFIEEAFTMTDTTDFTGTVRCTAPAEGMFTGLAVEVDAANRILTSLPVMPVAQSMPRQ